MERVVSRLDIEGAGQDGHIISAIYRVIGRRDIDREVTVDHEAGRIRIAYLDAVLAGRGVRDFGICRFLIRGVFRVRQLYIAANDDLHLASLVAGKGGTGGTGQIQILKDQNDARGALFDGDIAV